MSLAALDANGKKQISYELSPEKSRQDWKCPHCQQSMSFVDSNLRIKHFRHFIDNECNPEPETIEHVNLKKYVYEWLTTVGYKCDYEVKIGNRIADITFFNVRTGKLRVIECQISLITNLELQQRNNDYRNSNIFEVYWILYPKNYLKPYKKYKHIFRLKDIERENISSPYLFYFDPSHELIKKYYFTNKAMRGGGGFDTCNTIYLKDDNELVINNRQVTNWGMVQKWIEGRDNERKRERKKFLEASHPGHIITIY